MSTTGFTGPVRVLAALLVGAAALTSAPGAAQRVVPETRTQLQLSFAPVVRRVAPAVVNIYSRRVVQSRGSPLLDDPLFRRFFGDGSGFGLPRQRVESSLGSGVVVAPDGVVVTNHHVVAGGEEVTVVFADRREFQAQIIGSDERTDLAVLRIDAAGGAFPYVDFRDSDSVEVGDLVLAIGNPFGVGQTVTSGIVSAEAQTRVGISDISFFIQTDAAINPGNSGGALVDMDGRLIGINTAIYSQSGGSLGIGFAVPSNMVRAVVAGFTSVGRLQRPWIGAVGQQVTSDMANALGLARPAGVLIDQVYRGGPADRADLRRGDVVLSVNGHAVDDPQALKYRVATAPVGSTLDLRLWRQGSERMLTLPVQTAPEDPPRDARELTGAHPLAGATVANLSPALAEELGEDSFQSGVVVLTVKPSSPAQRVGLQPGDRVLAVNGEDVSSSRGVEKQMRQRVRRWQLLIGRGERRFSMVIDG